MEVKAQLKPLQDELSELERQAQSNVDEDDTKVECTIEELDGLPESILQKLEPVEGKEETHRYVSMAYPEIKPALQLVNSDEVRRRLFVA